MSQKFLNINNLKFTYENSVNPIFENFSIQFEQGWTGIVGPNGSGKSTLLKLITGELAPDDGSIILPGNSCYCEQRTEEKPIDHEEFLYSYSKAAFWIREQLQIHDEWFDRWGTLSQGERRRCQLATALNINPTVFAIDEPTNHLDYKTRKVIVESLKQYKGIGLLISHDREMLDEICKYTLILKPCSFVFRKGAYSEVMSQLESENEAAHHLLESRQKEIKKLAREVKSRKAKAGIADLKKSKKNIAKKDHDTKSKIDAARLTGKDATEGQIYKRLQSRLEKLEEIKNSINIEKKKILGIDINSEKSSKRTIMFIDEGKINLGENKTFQFPSLFIERSDRIGLIGNNGTGKTSFIDHLLKTIPFDQDKLIYLKQEISLSESNEIVTKIQNLKNFDKGKIITIIDKLGSDPKKVLQMKNPSPGEIRKLILAEGLLKSPELIIMDEPTNHMDLPSIDCLERALKEVECALLLISHDKVFLENIGCRYWEIVEGKLIIK